jgi:hypothetical protein
MGGGGSGLARGQVEEEWEGGDNGAGATDVSRRRHAALAEELRAQLTGVAMHSVGGGTY